LAWSGGDPDHAQQCQRQGTGHHAEATGQHARQHGSHGERTKEQRGRCARRATSQVFGQHPPGDPVLAPAFIGSGQDVMRLAVGQIFCERQHVPIARIEQTVAVGLWDIPPHGQQLGFINARCEDGLQRHQGAEDGFQFH